MTWFLVFHREIEVKIHVSDKTESQKVTTPIPSYDKQNLEEENLECCFSHFLKNSDLLKIVYRYWHMNHFKSIHQSENDIHFNIYFSPQT